MRSKYDLTEAAQNLRTAAAWIEASGMHALLATEPTPERGDGPRPEISRPTEAAAVAHLEGTRDWLAPMQGDLLAWISAGNDAAVSVVTLLGQITDRLPKEDARCSDPLDLGCRRPAAPGRQGRCNPCRMRQARAEKGQDGAPLP